MAGTSHSIEGADFIAFDLETTGLHPTGDRIIEIGAVRFAADGSVVDEFEQLVRPDRPIPAEATAVNGISDEMVADQPAIHEVLPRFLDFLGNASILLAHNAPFDLSFLAVACGRCGCPPPTHPIVDTCHLARRRISLPNYKLETLGRHLRVIDVEEHRALSDACLLTKVFLHLVQRPLPIRNARQLLELSPGLSVEQFGALVDDPPAGFEELWNAMAEGTPIEMAYTGGSTPGATRVVTPLGVIETRGVLYLSALCHKSKCEKTYRLDRIASYQKKT